MYLLTLREVYFGVMNSEIKPTLNIRGFKVFAAHLLPDGQRQMIHDLRNVVTAAPMFSPMTPGGRKMSVKMSAAGQYGWYTDAAGYRYIDKHPNGSRWPEIPTSILSIWEKLVSKDRAPDCCLINYYAENTKMSMHQDKDETDFSWPVLSISLGDDALFRIGGVTRTEKTESIWLNSGDVVLMGGDARLAFHGIDRIKFGTSTLLDKGGRINLTLRVVD